MPLIQVLNASPSSTEKKRQLLASLTATYAEVMEIRPDTIRVILHELPPRELVCRRHHLGGVRTERVRLNRNGAIFTGKPLS